MKLLILALLILITQSVFPADIKRETRAVWLTTNFALDWPPRTYDEEEQKSALKKIFEDLSRKKFNTVYFQVRSNGTVLYNSEIEPFSPYFKGTVGTAPNYDPLQYAIELGKEYNLEVHAWVNMIRCFSGSDDSFLKHPKHIRNKHPELTVRVMGENGTLSYWMNPGYYKAQDYLVDLLIELTSKYDVDGIQLDFFRYPGEKFDDEKHFNEYDYKISIAEWRRNNLTLILRKLNENLNPKNLYLKIGVTPIGIRKNLEGAVGWQGYSSAFQDTEMWLKEGLVDYLAPQIYWDFANNPRFDVLAEDWVNKSFNKNIVIGLAAYKKEIKKEITKMIEFSRNIGAAGISFFRYSFVSGRSEEYFNEIIFPADMPWKYTRGNNYAAHLNSTIDLLSDDEVIIGWQDTNDGISNQFRSYILLLEGKPNRFFSLNKNKLKLKFGKPSKLVYNYQICKLDRLWNYSSATQNLEVPVPYLYKLKRASLIDTKPKLHRRSDNINFLSLYSPVDQSANIDYINIENIRKQEIKELIQGINLLEIREDIDSMMKIIITLNRTGEAEELIFFN